MNKKSEIIRPRAFRGASSLMYMGAVAWVRPDTKSENELCQGKDLPVWSDKFDDDTNDHDSNIGEDDSASTKDIGNRAHTELTEDLSRRGDGTPAVVCVILLASSRVACWAASSSAIFSSVSPFRSHSSRWVRSPTLLSASDMLMLI